MAKEEITKEEAINITKCLVWHARPGEEDIEQEIKILKQESCNDCISRQAVFEIIEREEFKGDAISEVEKLPPVTPQSKIGRWIKVTNGRGGHECDLCHEYAPSYQSGDEHLTNYCPNCGVKMRETKE